MTILDAIGDRALFGGLSVFRDLASWGRWLVFLRALFALPMTDDERTVFTHHTGRQAPPTEPPSEVFVCAGRRSGKSFVSALVAVYVACFRDVRPFLAPGERAMVLVIASDREQAAIILRYVRSIITSVPMLKAMIERETSDTIELANRVTIAVATCSYRSVRGLTLAAVICDEISFWRVDGANPDREVMTALRPAMATIPGALLLCISTPYAKSGVLYEALRDHHGVDESDVLTWKATSIEMNPTLSAAKIQRDRERDPSAAVSEWDAEFRADLESFLSPELIAACVEQGVAERSPVDGVRYFGAVDMAGGGADASVLAIAHAERRAGEAARVTLDLVRGWRGPDVEAAAAEMAAHLRRYRISRVVGDRFGAEWTVSAFRRHGIAYRHSTRTRSEAYIELHPIIATGRAVLLDHATLLRELRQLERRTGRGRDIVDHPPRLHDDHANGAALALVEADVKPVRDLRAAFVGSGRRRRAINPLATFLNER